MAGDWLKWVKGLADKREIALIAASLRRDRYEVAGRCMKLWEWCDDNIPEDRVSDSHGAAVIVLSPHNGDNAAFIDSLVGLEGFANAMASAGWLHFRSGSVEFPNFSRHNGTTAKTRARNGLNQSRRRQAARPPVTTVSPSPGDE